MSCMPSSTCVVYFSLKLNMGHVVSKEGISIDPKEIKAIMEWPTPMNVDEVKSLIGLSGYYRQFVGNI